MAYKLGTTNAINLHHCYKYIICLRYWYDKDHIIVQYFSFAYFFFCMLEDHNGNKHLRLYCVLVLDKCNYCCAKLFCTFNHYK